MPAGIQKIVLDSGHILFSSAPKSRSKLNLACPCPLMMIVNRDDRDDDSFAGFESGLSVTTSATLRR